MCGLGTLDSAVIKALKFELWICLTCLEGSVYLNHLPSDEDLPVRLKSDEELAPLPIWHPWIWNVADNLLFTIWQPEICYFWSDSLKASGNFDPGRTIAPHWSQLSNKQLDHSSWPALALPKCFQSKTKQNIKPVSKHAIRVFFLFLCLSSPRLNQLPKNQPHIEKRGQNTGRPRVEFLLKTKSNESIMAILAFK